jgi:hypothetical protein
MTALRRRDPQDRAPVTIERTALAAIGINITMYRSVAQLTLALEAISEQMSDSPQKDFVVKAVQDTKNVNAELVRKIDDFLKMVAPEDLDDER